MLLFPTASQAPLYHIHCVGCTEPCYRLIEPLSDILLYRACHLEHVSPIIRVAPNVQIKMWDRAAACLSPRGPSVCLFNTRVSTVSCAHSPQMTLPSDPILTSQGRTKSPPVNNIFQKMRCMMLKRWGRTIICRCGKPDMQPR